MQWVVTKMPEYDTLWLSNSAYNMSTTIPKQGQKFKGNITEN